MKNLLTKVIIRLVNEYAIANEYGVALVTIPDFDYVQFIRGLDISRRIQIFFLGFSAEQQQTLAGSLLDKQDMITYDFSVEAAERSRNSGDEQIFRILIIKRAEIEKISSLRWFPEITLEKAYLKSCDFVKDELPATNTVILSLIRALKSKPVRSILSFERVLRYLELLLDADNKNLPGVMKDGFYILGLCEDKRIDAGNPGKEDFVRRIRHNHEIVERLGNLEQAERQSITNYYSKTDINADIPRLILDYYRTHDISLLKHMEIDEVEQCLKTVKRLSLPNSAGKGGGAGVKPTAVAVQLAFDNQQEQIEKLLSNIEHDLDRTPDSKKAERREIESGDIRLQIHIEPVTQTIAAELTGENDYGGIIRADVQSPGEAIRDIGKYAVELFGNDLIEHINKYLQKLAALTDGERISKSLNEFLTARGKISCFRKRLQDAPMLQVLAEYPLFAEYLSAYEKLLNSINEDFHKIWDISASKAKEIINYIMSLDYVFIVGEERQHALPTPLHPLYLWKYIELAKEIISGRGIQNSEPCHLSDEDKSFIIRKADDIPDPLSVMLMPEAVAAHRAAFLPLSGRMGMLPVYSDRPQINQSENGIEILKQQIVRYLCLYPHAGMRLKLAVIDPPSVSTVVAMLKALDRDREFNILGMEVSVYRTKEVPCDWVEIEDDALNEGMLGRVKGKRSLSFRLQIADQRLSYTEILSKISQTQHILIIFDPNEVKIETVQNNKQIQLHPLCVPKIYKYDPVDERVVIRPANEGGVFTVYASILEKLNEQPSTFSHTSTYFNTPLKKDTYDRFLDMADWLVILDQSLKSWDIALRAESEKLFYREDSYRSIGIYSKNCRKFIAGYDALIKQLGNFIPQETGIKRIIDTIREINDDGLLSIVSHSSNRIFDTNHGKGSLGIAIAALTYKQRHSKALIVGLDTQLAREWLSEREDGKLPDLIGITIDEGNHADIDIIEVKTYSDRDDSFKINGAVISGHAIEQAAILEALVREMFGTTEKITTVSRREILREQVFEGLFQAEMDAREKLKYSNQLNDLFAGQYELKIEKNIFFIDLEDPNSEYHKQYRGENELANDYFYLTTIGSKDIQSILSAGACGEPESLPSIREEASPDEQNGTALPPINSDESGALQKRVTEAIIGSPTATAKRNLLEEKCARINKVLRDYSINAYPVTVENVSEAARFTRFAVELKSGESVRSLEKYRADIGRQLEANGEILIDHIKGTRQISVDVPFAGSAGSIKLLDHLELLDNSTGQLNIIAGQLADGSFDIIDVADAPHMLIAGTTGSGKTVFLHTIIVSLLHQYTADELELLIIDPKQTDFVFFENIPHLYGRHIVTDAEEALERLQTINARDKEERTLALRSCRSKDIASYNLKNPDKRMKRLVVIIDEYSDLIQAAEMNGTRKEFEKNLLMLLQRVRNLGIHLIIATQRPSAQIITGALKAVIPFRVSFRLPSHIDSQTILDMSGAENLLGKGDMLMVTESEKKRMQGLYISEEELEEFVSKL